VVGWLPFYHDMGLIGNLLQSLYLGSTAILMSPLAFLEQPVRWLRAISKYRAATSGGPNFAYELCVRKVTPEQKRDLDLSSWTLAFNGSEPVRATTVERFTEVFAECGFRRESFFPCYGLAEATLFVTGPTRGEPLVVRHLNTAVEQDQANSAQTDPMPGPRESAVVCCGRAWTGHQVQIINPETKLPCPDGQVGEIWVAGSSVAQGYWNRSKESDNTFRATIAEDTNKTFLRTGDLGLVENGEPYVTGRTKDLIILRGRNYYPQDLERVLDEQVEGLRSGCNAAFSVTVDDEEALVLLAEVNRLYVREHGVQAILAAMRQALAEACDAPIGELVLVSPGSVPKTSSGKVRRQACKEAYLEGHLNVLARSDEGSAVPSAPNPLTESGTIELLRDALQALPKTQRAPLISRFLVVKIASLLRIPEPSLAADLPLCSIDLNSLQAVELKHAVDALLGKDVTVSRFLSDSSIKELAGELAEASLHATEMSTESQEAACGLSFAQQAMLTVHQLDLNSIVYNLHLALRIHGPLDPEVLHHALDRLIERHEVLHTVYRTEGDTVVQRAVQLASMPDYFSVIDARAWTESQLQEDFARRAREPFDLARGPVLQVTLYRHDDQTHVLLFCAHHIALDLWSLLLFLNELRTVYEALVSGCKPALRPHMTRYRDFVAWQRAYLASPAAEAAWYYWRTQLAGEMPLLDLHADRPRSPTPAHRGASVALRIGLELTERLEALTRRQGVTLFTLLLAAYKVLLHRYTQARDLMVGVPGSGRAQGRFTPVVGNFVNPLPVRTSLSPDLPFSAYLTQVREAVLGALAHHDFPFHLLVERLKPERSPNRWPIYQVMFALQASPSWGNAGLAALALGEEGVEIEWPGLRVESACVEERVARFDLLLTAALLEDGLLLSISI
jgi:hypothetical protein